MSGGRIYIVIPASSGVYPSYEEAHTAAEAIPDDYVIVSHARDAPTPRQPTPIPPAAKVVTLEDEKLLFAVENTEHHLVLRYMNKGHNPNLINEHGNSLLHIAARTGDTLSAQTLIFAGADVNATNNWGQTPLIIAASNARTGVMHILITAGAVVDAIDVDGDTPFILTGINSHHTYDTCGIIERFAMLIAAGANVNAANYTGTTALHGAIGVHDSVILCRFLLDMGADPTRDPLIGNSASTAIYTLLSTYGKEIRRTNHLSSRIKTVMSVVQHHIDESGITSGWHFSTFDVECRTGGTVTKHDIALTHAPHDDIYIPIVQIMAIPEIASADEIRFVQGKIILADDSEHILVIASDFC